MKWDNALLMWYDDDNTPERISNKLHAENERLKAENKRLRAEVARLQGLVDGHELSDRGFP